MTTLSGFKALRSSVSAEQGVTLTVDQVREFLRQMNEESEFDDIELDAVALAVVAGGQGGGSGNC